MSTHLRQSTAFCRLPAEGAMMRRDLRNSCLEGSCHSLMVGLAETWFAAFFIAANIGNVSLGLLATLPMLIGSLLQLGTPWGMQRIGSYRTWAVAGSVSQGLSLIGLGVLCAVNCVSVELAFLAMVFYWGSSFAVGPAWNTWMEFVIPKPVRTKFLSTRMRICQFSLLIAVCVAGFVLHWSASENRQSIFSILFLAAGVFRLISAGLLQSHREHLGWTRASLNPVGEAQQAESFSKTVREVIPFFVAIQFSVYISGPFFAPFMLRTMGMDYAAFMFLIVLGFVGRILTLHIASNLARSRGPGWLLMCGTVGIVPLSGLWWFHESFLFLAVMQLLGGVAWGCYELAMSLVFIERIPRHLRPRVLSVYGLCNGIAMVSGSLLGGLILNWMGNQASGFMVVFIGSSILRALSMVFLPRALFEERIVNVNTLQEPLLPATPQLNGRPEINSFANLSSSLETQRLEPLAEILPFELPSDSAFEERKRSA